MAMRRDPTGPSQATIKRLFAHSGNRCAFPRCMEVLVEEGTVVGKVCHIKAANPKGPRYDPQQTTAERHGYGNLVLLCGKHHTVIDDDEESYTVERLIKMKADHQSRTRRVDEAFAERAVQILVNQPVISMNQSGGIAAHTINAGTINLHSPSVPESPHDSWQLRPTAKGASSFIDDGRILCHPRSLFGAEPVLAIIWYNYPQFFMRIIPSTPPPKPWSRTEVKAMIDRARLTPLPHYYESYFSTTNEFGAVVLNCRNVEAQNSAEQITQVTRFGEIWGIDKRSIVGKSRIKFGENRIAHALNAYLSFARDQLGLQAPVTLMAGLTGVQGFEFQHPMNNQVGPHLSNTNCNSPNIMWETTVDDLNVDSRRMLLPFFDMVWDTCGLARSEWFPEEYPQQGPG